ncbi:heparan-alpha-glucosaminide N-acetyltransferase domain-containing protein [Schlesneria paludicola]|uniref:heparan-alpha-glucosaminide N-acetyltransferase domain-containing protein n=1 Tax=Schlesneria paludicola TaxID=360056 RepID=UPI0002D74478|nr:heparan-alpha-glucosaminide N-acetyltransferase domain-containing protein [Schlesneria paludicola]
MNVTSTAEPPRTIAGTERLVSLDQFRGYTVAGMILVNFIGSFAVVHSIFKHNNNYFSYADSIMPGFHFAVGYSYRLTFLRRLYTDGTGPTYLRFLRRSVSLILIAILFFGAGGGFPGGWQQFYKMPTTWDVTFASLDAARREAEERKKAEPREEIDLQANPIDDSDTAIATDFSSTFAAQWRVYLARLLKSEMWNTFAIIGATQLLILPVIAAGARTRVVAAVLCGLGHMTLTAWFNWGFVLGNPDNWMVRLWKTGDESSWDGGFFGPLCWAVAMLAGTLVADLMMQGESAGRVARRILTYGCGLMLFAYVLSCGSRLYDVEFDVPSDPVLPNVALSPMLPNWDSLGRRHISSLLTEPPFVAPPPATERLDNYWMMSKRLPTLSFILFATGFSAALYAVFLVVCQVWHWECSVFRTFGMNPLAAYVIHELIGFQLHPLVPNDSPLWYCLIGLTVYGLAVYLCVRSLEKSKIYLRI